jgi:two-component system, NarL family, invasion response regulator UvrY
MRVLLTDDHPMVRAGISQLLREAGGFEIAEAGDHVEAMRALRSADFDVMVLDMDLPGRNGLEITRIAKGEFPRLAVLLYTMHPEWEYGVRALRAGASGYLPKSAAPEKLVEAIRTVAAGRRFVTPELAQALAEAVGDAAGDRPPHELLSDREFQTLKLIASGMRLADIAEALSLSPKTVSVYRARLLEKMRMSNNAELTHYALKHKLVD